MPYVKCGKVFEPDLPNALNKYEPPIVLAEATVDIQFIPSPYILIKYSQFINFTLLGLNSKIKILYRLVRIDNLSKDIQILQEWEFGFETADPNEISNVDTNQPTVLNYCDDQNRHLNHILTYRLEIVQIETNNIKNYGITNKSITGMVLNSEYIYYGVQSLPFAACGQIYNPVLPLHLTRKEKPIKLTQVSFRIQDDRNICLLINFSGFITSVLKEGHFNNLIFRLVEKVDNSNEILLQEWPFRRAFVNNTNIYEPIDYNFCDCAYSRFYKHYTYTIELIEAELSEESYYNISQKNMTAQVYQRPNQQASLRMER